MRVLSLLPMLLTGVLSAQTGFTTYVPHLADGGSWTTLFTIVNLSDNNPGTGTLKFHGEDGSPLTIPLTGTSGTVSQVPINLPPNASMVVETAGSGAATRQGWVELNDQSVPSALSLTAVFHNHVPNYPDLEASVFGLPVATKAFAFAYDNSPGYSTAIAMINSSSLFTGVVTVTVRDDAGKLLVTENISLPVGQHLAFSVPARYPGTAGKRGTVLLTPDLLVWLNALAFRFTPLGPFPTSPFTTLPPIVK